MVMKLGPWVVMLMSIAPVAATTPFPDVHLLYRGVQDVAPLTAIDQSGGAIKITGLSGIAYAGGSTFWAVMDNSDKLVRFDVTFRDDCSIRKIKVAGGITLSERRDYEGIAIARQEAVYLSEETTPALWRVDLATGRLIREVVTPGAYRHVQRNQGLESLSASPDGKWLWTANERALLLDGNLKAPLEPFGATTRVRLQRFNLAGEIPRAAGQFVYRTSGVHQFA
ncbi:MAG: esterase-like activity of phytase family protein, partial [Gemmatimonadaceae bacterium]|nr:esterase-like activity of phytase family protein [Gemmatimonadaceae bacterium]